MRYSALELYKDGDLYQEIDLENPVEQMANPVRSNSHLPKREVVFADLPYGNYQARLRDNKNLFSDFVSFEVIDINISYTVGEKLTVYFSSANATPEFMSLGDARECPYFCTVFSDEQIAQGFATVALNSDYLKVHFRGEYGRVSNKIIKVRQSA